MNPQQLALGLSLNDEATFANYYAPSSSPNAQILAALHGQITNLSEPLIYLWGAPGCGLTHLLQGACHQAHKLQKSFQYIPLRELAECAPEEVLLGLESLDFVVLDSLEAVAGRRDWEFALFSLFNRLREAGSHLLVAARQGPKQLPVSLPDLKSRWQWGAVFHVHPLDDAQKQAALQLRARARGLELNEEVALYILQRLPRTMNELVLQLQRLDSASLAEQRKLTIPFVKKILEL